MPARGHPHLNREPKTLAADLPIGVFSHDAIAQGRESDIAGLLFHEAPGRVSV